MMSSIFLRNGSAQRTDKPQKPVSLYLVRFSPQCRAVWLYLAQNKIPYKLIDVDISFAENGDQELDTAQEVAVSKVTALPAKCPAHTLPVLTDGEVTVFGGHSVLRYLSSRYTCYSGYGRTLADRMLVESLLEWTDSELHRVLGFRCIYPQISSKYQLPSQTSNEQLIEKGFQELSNMLDFLEETYLKTSPFLTGSQITIADIYICTVLLQAEWASFHLHLWPLVIKWMGEVEKQPFWEDVHFEHRTFVQQLRNVDETETVCKTD